MVQTSPLSVPNHLCHHKGQVVSSRPTYTSLLSVSVDLLLLDTSCKCDRTMCDLLFLASFTESSVLEIDCIIADSRHQYLVPFNENSILYSIKYCVFREFPGCPGIRTLTFHCRGLRFEHWLRILRSHVPCGQKKRKTYIYMYMYVYIYIYIYILQKEEKTCYSKAFQFKSIPQSCTPL